MSPVVCSYVRRQLLDLFCAALDTGHWWWPRPDVGPAGHAAVRSPSTAEPGLVTPGAVLVLGYRGPDARIAPGGWHDGLLARLAVSTITDVAHDDASVHVTFDTFFQGLDVRGVQLDPFIMEALRLSANQHGRPVAPDSPWASLGTLAQLIERYPRVPDSTAPPTRTW